ESVAAVGLRDRGVADQQGVRAERLAGLGDQPHTGGAAREVGLADCGTATVTLDGFGELFGLFARAAIMDDDAIALRRQPGGDGGADAVGGAGDERVTGGGGFHDQGYGGLYAG